MEERPSHDLPATPARQINLDVLTQGLKYGISGLMNLATNPTSDTTSDAQSNGPYFVNFNQDCT